MQAGDPGGASAHSLWTLRLKSTLPGRSAVGKPLSEPVKRERGPILSAVTAGPTRSAPIASSNPLRPRAGLIGLHRRRISKDGTNDKHPPARDEVRQVVRQPLDVFARFLLEALHFGDLGDQHVVGLTDGLSGNVRRPGKPPVRDRVQRPADSLAILRHQTLKLLGQFRRTQLKPNQKGRRRTHPRSVVDNRSTTNGVMPPSQVDVGYGHHLIAAGASGGLGS